MTGSRACQADWDQPHRCPGCHAVVTWAGFRPGITCACGTCGTRLARRQGLPPVQHPGWTLARCLRDGLRQNWNLRARNAWAFREIRHPRSWWHARGDQGPLIRALARARIMTVTDDLGGCHRAARRTGRKSGLPPGQGPGGLPGTVPAQRDARL
jgi:hypothetical protein